MLCLAVQISHAARALWRDFRQELDEDVDQGLQVDSPHAQRDGREGPAELPGEEGSDAAAAVSASASAGSGSVGLTGTGATAAAGGRGTAAAGVAEATEHAALVKASAYYYVTYHPDCQRQGAAAGAARLFSFPWLVADRLAQIKSWRGRHR